MKTIKHSTTVIALLCGFSIIWSCNYNEQKTEMHHEHVHEEAGMDGVELTNVQIESAALEYGKFDTLNISDFVRANGTLDLPPKNVSSISAPLGGFIKNADFLIGDHVEKGATLVVLEHPDYIDLQERYITQLGKFNYLESEWNRQRKLDSANVSAKKKLQEAVADYISAQATKQALEKKLIFIGLNPDQVAKGNISSQISIRAPFSGYITKLNVHNGEYVKAEKTLYEIVDIDHMHLELEVFEQDIYKVKIGQQIRYNIPSISDKSFEGEVILVGKSFDPERKTVKVHGHLSDDHPEFIRGLFTEAKIYIGNDHVVALPEDAIVMDKGKYYIFIKSKSQNHDHTLDKVDHGEHSTYFRRVRVQTGVREKEYVELKNLPVLNPGEEIVIKGAYFLYAEMKKGEGGHHSH